VLERDVASVEAAGGPELFIVPTSYRGRDCLRLCWGIYDDEAARVGAAVDAGLLRQGWSPPARRGCSEILH